MHVCNIYIYNITYIRRELKGPLFGQVMNPNYTSKRLWFKVWLPKCPYTKFVNCMKLRANSMAANQKAESFYLTWQCWPFQRHHHRDEGFTTHYESPSSHLLSPFFQYLLNSIRLPCAVFHVSVHSHCINMYMIYIIYTKYALFT